MRYVFNVTDAQAAETQALKLLVDCDDSFVAYVNGGEVARAFVSHVGKEVGQTDERGRNAKQSGG
jgi:hypothetical protein